MRAGLENWLVRHWYGPQRPPWYLRMLVPVYAAAFRRQHGKGLADRYRSNRPLIVVGNITAGGSGKTPLVIRLCELAQEMGLKPGIVTTGYGRTSRETLVVQADCDAATCGDEPVLLAQRTGVPVVVAANRRDALDKLADLDLDLVVSDDGLQQADLERDIEFCVVDGERGLGNRHLIPAGPLREPAERLRHVDFVVANGAWRGKPDGVNAYLMSLKANVVRSLDGASEYPVAEFRKRTAGKPLHAIAGIGHPQRFFDMLKTLGFEALSLGFSDHHSFRRADFDSITADAAIIMTEKDAVKCRSLGLKNAWYVPLETTLSEDLEKRFKHRLAELIRGR